MFFLFSKFLPIVPVVEVKEGKGYGELRKVVLKDKVKRAVERTVMEESRKIEDI